MNQSSKPLFIVAVTNHDERWYVELQSEVIARKEVRYNRERGYDAHLCKVIK